MEPLWMTLPWAGVPRRGVKMSSGMVDAETTTHMQHDMSSGGGTRQEGDRASLHTHCPFLLSPGHETLSAITMIIQSPGPELSFWGSRVVSCFAPNCQTYHMSCSHSFEMKIYTTHLKMQIHNTVAHYSRPTHTHTHTHPQVLHHGFNWGVKLFGEKYVKLLLTSAYLVGPAMVASASNTYRLFFWSSFRKQYSM